MHALIIFLAFLIIATVLVILINKDRKARSLLSIHVKNPDITSNDKIESLNKIAKLNKVIVIKIVIVVVLTMFFYVLI